MWSKYEQWQFDGTLAVWYEAAVPTDRGLVPVTVWKSKDYGKGKWAFSLTSGPCRVGNKRRTVAEAKKAAVELTKKETCNV